ncbi:MAG TPA: SurA N-terminal domain-containing protein [Kofleriaceae bacterium]|nr:SurA N-terminal domain-containing protein [Kofleriaceae bacterium]
MIRGAVGLVIVAGAIAAADPPRPPVGATATIDRIVAMVGTQPIWRSQIDERRYGQPASPELDRAILDSLIDGALEQQRADELHLTASDDEIDLAIKAIEAQNKVGDAELDQALAVQGLSRASYRLELARQLVAQKAEQLDLAPRVSPIGEDQVRSAYAELKAREPATGPLDGKLYEQLRQRLFDAEIEGLRRDWLAARRRFVHIERRP